MTKELRILVVDDDFSMTQTLGDILGFKGYSVETANSGTEALDEIQKQSFDCMLTDIKMPGITGVELARRARELQPGIPVLLMTAYAAEDQRSIALEEGALDIVNKPLDLNYILKFFDTIQDECVVTIVDDAPEFCNSLQEILERRSFRVKTICAPEQEMDEHSLDTQVLLLDMKLRNQSGLDVLREIREKNPNLPVIIITGYQHEMAESIQTALSLNAFTCLNKPVQIEELLLTITKIRYQQVQYR
jgi:DNA-binding NtrC family response regulator